MAQRFDGNRVSNEHYYVLRAAREVGDVEFRLNDGNRTLGEQRYLYTHQPPLAAFPSPWAPHIRVGRSDHALDIDQWVGDGVRAFVAWCKRVLGLAWAWTVPGEGWHIEVVGGAAALKRAAKKAKAMLAPKPKPDPLKPLGPINRRRAERLLWHRRKRNAAGTNHKAAAGHAKHVTDYRRSLEAEIRKLRKPHGGKAPPKGTNARRQYDVLHRIVNDRDGRL